MIRTGMEASGTSMAVGIGVGQVWGWAPSEQLHSRKDLTQAVRAGEGRPGHPCQRDHGTKVLPQVEWGQALASNLLGGGGSR